MNRRTTPAESSDVRRLKMDSLFSLLNNDIRRELLAALAMGEKDVATLAFELELDPSSISHRLNDLFVAGLVAMRQEWRQHLYCLTESVTATIENRRVSISIAVDDGSMRFDLPIS
jgi:DNA-binding transcriptional ArsR family regulator